MIIDLITIDLQPLSIVENTAVVALIKFLDPKYHLPSSKVLKEWLKRRYEETREAIKRELDSVKKVCVTTDLWTNINTDSLPNRYVSLY